VSYSTHPRTSLKVAPIIILQTAKQTLPGARGGCDPGGERVYMDLCAPRH